MMAADFWYTDKILLIFNALKSTVYLLAEAPAPLDEPVMAAAVVLVDDPPRPLDHCLPSFKDQARDAKPKDAIRMDDMAV